MADQRRETIRAFLALDLDSTSVRRIARVADRLRTASGAPSATWVAPAQMHVTLKFIAELPVAFAGPLGMAIRPVVEGKRAPKPCSFRLDAFPRAEDAQVIVATLQDMNGDLSKLAGIVDKLTFKFGVPKEERAFRPHVTLARLKRPYDARRWLRPGLAEAAGECTVTGLTLFRSELGAAGATHIPLARCGFQPG
jgi:2'-5' RNA ligase